MAVILNAAVLHILDFSKGVVSLSDEPLNLEDEVIENYIEKLVRRVSGSTDSQPGTFDEFSPFLKDLQEFENKESTFMDFSLKTVNRIRDELEDITLNALGLLMVYYEEDEVPSVCLMLLENQEAYTYETGIVNDHIANSIIYAPAVLPSPERKVKGFAVVNTVTNSIQFLDEIKWNVSDLHVMADSILHCRTGQSHREVLSSITAITNDIAEEYEENPTVLLTKVKNYIRESAEEEKPVQREDLAVHVFNASDDMQNTFIEKAMEADLPEEVELPKKVISREMKTQHIRTDTGISLSFPVEYASDPSRIEFIHHDDGTISIELHHIGHITNRK